MNCNLAATLQALKHSIAVIGYGNDLRSDDGIGQKIATTVAAWGVPKVRSLAVHQLTPEIAEILATVEIAIFVDAELGSTAVKVMPLQPANTDINIGHTSNPPVLLAMSQAIYGRYPQAWLVTIPAVNFELGDRFSSIAENGMAEALEEIDYLIRNHSLSELT